MTFRGWNIVALFVATIAAVFLQTRLDTPRLWFGAQIDLLPALIVYAGLTTGVGWIAVLAVVAGLASDSLSMNPLGIAIMPLFMTGIAVHHYRDLILRDQILAQATLGLVAGAAVPALTLAMLILVAGTGIERPAFGWGRLWQWLVMTLGSAVLTPVVFWLFDRFNRTFNYQQMPESSFRGDREIVHGKF